MDDLLADSRIGRRGLADERVAGWLARTAAAFLRREYPTRKKRGERGNSLVYAPFKLPPHSPLSPPPPRRRLRPRRDRKKGKKENNNEKEEEKDMEG